MTSCTQQTLLPRRKINKPRQTSSLRGDATNCSSQQTWSQSRIKVGTQETCLKHMLTGPSPGYVTWGRRNSTENVHRCFMQNTGIFARCKIFRWTLIIFSSRFLFYKRLNKLINYDENRTLCFTTGLDSKSQILTGVKVGSIWIDSSATKTRNPP